MNRLRPAAAGQCSRTAAAVRPFLVLIMLFAASAASAQDSSQNTSPTSNIDFLPRTAFHLNAEHLSSDDPRFVWDTNFGGEVDIVDYGVGRATFVANYQAMLGEQLRKFDPNQGNYTLEGSSSARIGGVEVALVFHHVSRHLGDRAKDFAIDWNMLGGRVQKAFGVGSTHMDARADLRKTTLHSYVDYTWELDSSLRTVHPLRSRIAAISDVGLRLVGVDGTRNRGTQTGAHGEGGLRFEGHAGAVELFLAAERRVDPWPLEFGVQSWVGAGFRLLSR